MTKINRSKLMKDAHRMVRNIKGGKDSYRELLSMAMKSMYRRLKRQMYQIRKTLITNGESEITLENFVGTKEECLGFMQQKIDKIRFNYKDIKAYIKHDILCATKTFNNITKLLSYDMIEKEVI